MPESNFEIAFSDLAHASLSEKAPGLMEYLVGFQLLDKNDEETHAVAVFGFKIGNQWFYAPVFFLNGTLKGMELLYVKNQDLFVPLQDNWVNYLISKQPRNIGQTEQVPEKELGIEPPDFSIFGESPGAGAKWASVVRTGGIRDWAKPFLPAYRNLVSGFKKRAAELADRMDLRNVLQRHPELTPNLVSTMKGNVKFAEAVISFYDLKELLPAPARVKQALLNLSPKIQQPVNKNVKVPLPQGESEDENASEEKAAGILDQLMGRKKEAEHVGDSHTYETRFLREYNSAEEILDSLTWKGKEKKATEGEIIEDTDREGPEIEVYTQEDAPTVLNNRDESATLTDAEKEQLQRGETVIRDHRDNTSKVYEAEFDRHLTNPTETGVYDVLTSTGEFERCLILHNPKTVGQGRTSGVCTLVSLDGNRWGNYRNIDILIHKAEQSESSFEDSMEEVRNQSKDFSSMRPGYLYVAVGPNGIGTIPFKYLTQISKNDGTTAYAVNPRTNVTRGKNPVRSTLGGYRLGALDSGDGIYLESFDNYGDSVAAVDSDDKRKRPYSRWELEDSRQLVVSDRSNFSRLSSTGGCSFVPAEGWGVIEIGADPDNRIAELKEQAVRFEPGGLMDAETFVLKLGAQDLIVQKDGPEFVIRHENGQKRLNKEAAIKHLVMDWVLRGDDAKELVKRAEDNRITQCFIKRAQGALSTPPGAPSFPSYPSRFSEVATVPVEEQQTNFLDVPGMQASESNRDEYDLMSDPEVQNALGAASKGQKEIFDTSVVGGLVKAVDVDALVDSFLPDMIKGMDRVGRVLFLYYWHNEDFRDRYGRQDLVELEDSLKNVFRSTGDLVLFLKQKTIDADPMTDAIDIDLEGAG